MSRRQLYSFGYGSDGQLGNRAFLGEEAASAVRVPQLVLGAPTNVNGVSVRSIATGEKHTLFLAEDGQVWSCGGNWEGQLGRGGSREGSCTIYPVQLSGGLAIVQIAAGRAHSAAVADDGRLFVWGSNAYGQLALPADIDFTNKPKRVGQLDENVVQVACGSDLTIAIVQRGFVFVWGRQPDGQSVFIPNRVAFFDSIPVVQVNAGSNYYVALTVSGALYAWGNNDYGQLGTSDNKERSTPQEVSALRSLNVVHVECGDSHTVALTYEGRVFVCGSDSFGQLGGGRRLPFQNSMQAVTDLLGSHVTRIACGRCHTIAVAGGKMYTFGLNSSGQLGTGSSRNQITPRPVDSISNVAAVFAGWDQSFCIQAKRIDEMLSGPNCLLQTPKFLSLRRIQEIFAAGDKLSIMAEFETVFSSLAAVNASFLYDSDRRFRCAGNNSCVDMDSLVLASGVIADCHDAEQYAELIASSLVSGNIFEHPWNRVQSVESLRIFLIVPSFYFFSSPPSSFDRSFHFKFASIILRLPKNSLSVLERWWSALEPRHFNRLVSSLVRALHRLLEGDVRSEAAAESLCSVLALLNGINVSLKKIAVDKFYLHILQKKVDIANDYASFVLERRSRKFLWSHYPFLMDAELKGILLHLEAQIQMQISMAANATVIVPFQMLFQPDPFFVINVRRDHIVEDTLSSLTSSTSDLKKPLKVSFIGEEGDDAGGLKKEFFMLLFQELLQPAYGMFVEDEDSHFIWFSGVEAEPNAFTLTGMLCALAIYNAVLVDFPFPLALYKKILNQPLALEDLSELSPSEGRSLQSILDYEEDDFEEVFGLTFTISLSLFGHSEEVELKQNGGQIPVTRDNKAEFVKLYVAKRLEEGVNGEIARQLRYFDDGFRKVIHSRILQFFQPQELMEMVIGNESYDWSLFRKNTVYKGVYHAEHEAIRCFWDVFFEFNIDQRKQFLQFLAGSTRIPVQGMSAVRMTIQPCDEKMLPAAHTCVLLLDLPPITNHEEMKRRLLICLENTRGFTLA